MTFNILVGSGAEYSVDLYKCIVSLGKSLEGFPVMVRKLESNFRIASLFFASAVVMPRASTHRTVLYRFFISSRPAFVPMLESILNIQFSYKKD